MKVFLTEHKENNSSTPRISANSFSEAVEKCPLNHRVIGEFIKDIPFQIANQKSLRVSNYRKSWLRAHKAYEKRVFGIMRRAFIDMTNKIPYESLTERTYKSIIQISVFNYQIENAYFDLYNQIGLMHGKRIGKVINKDLKDFNPIVFENAYSKGLYQWILNNVGYRITTVRNTYIKFIQDIIAEGFSNGKTIVQIAKEIKELVGKRSFYRWQSLRIARTETTAAANRGASIAGTSSRVVLDKIWISAQDNRTRRKPDDRFDHYHMNLQKVPLNDGFNVQGEVLEYPGSPVTINGNPSSSGNVINCRCTIAQVPRRDRNGRIVRL